MRFLRARKEEGRIDGEVGGVLCGRAAAPLAVSLRWPDRRPDLVRGGGMSHDTLLPRTRLRRAVLTVGTDMRLSEALRLGVATSMYCATFALVTMLVYPWRRLATEAPRGKGHRLTASGFPRRTCRLGILTGTTV